MLLPVSVCEQIIVGPHGVPDPPSLAQMTFTQCSSMYDLEFDGQIEQYVSFSALFESLTKDMARKYGCTMKNFTLDFSLKFSGGLPIHVQRPGKKINVEFFRVGPYV